MSDILTIGLSSVTVFWEDLGLPPRSKITKEQDDELYVFWEQELGPWITDNVKGHYNPHVNGVWFADPQDAMLFKLTWAGMIPLKS